MSQTSIIAGTLVIAFFVFITVRGELPYYLAVFSGTSPAGSTTTVNQTNTGVSLNVNPGGGANVALGGNTQFGQNAGWNDLGGGSGINPGTPPQMFAN